MSDLSPAAKALLCRIKEQYEHVSLDHVKLREGEDRAAKELVNRELCFYSMDTHHLHAYKPCATPPPPGELKARNDRPRDPE